MGKTQKYSSIISVKTDADFSSLINALNKVQSEMKTKMSGKDALGIEESLDKIKQLQEKLKTIKERGFSSPKDVSDYNRLMDQLIDKATDVQSAFKRIHLTGLDKEVDKLDNDLKKAKNNIKNIANEIGKAVGKATKGNKNSEDFVTETKKAVEAGKDLQKVQENITQTIQAQITAQKQLVAEQQKRIDSVKYKNSISHVTAQSFTFDESKKSRWKGPDDNKSIMNYVTSSYNKVLENKNITTSASAMTKFIELLDKVGLKFKDNSKAIEKFDQAFTKAYDSEGSILLQANKQLKEQTETLKDLEVQAKNSENIFGTKTVQSLLEQYKNGAISIEELTKKLEQARIEANNKQLPQSINNVGTELNNASKKSQEFQSSLNNISQSQVQFDSVTGSIANFAKRILSVTTAYHTLRRIVRSTFEDIKNLDKAFGSIAMVTDYSVSDMWQQYTTYAAMANKLGQTTQSVIEASGLYYQQGLQTVEVMKLTEDTMKLATLAGLDFKEATSQMTGALRAFHMEMNQGAHVTDVYASLAASAAADVNGISEAMSATAAIAHSAGMSFENTSAMLTTMIEATQEAPKNLGTAMKAIIARFTELKNSVAGTAASEFEDLDYNKVDKALKSVGISIKDAAGQFRNLDEVFLELSGKWNTLDRNTQRYIATIAAGSRQQSRFIALMENYDRTMELIEVADNSANKADKQFAKYSDTVEFKLNRLKNTWEQAKTTVFTSDFFGGLIEGATALVEKLEKLDWKKLLVMLPVALAAGRMMGKTWIQGFTDGASRVKNFLGGKFIGKTNKTATELQADFYGNKARLSELSEQKIGVHLGNQKNFIKNNQKYQELDAEWNKLNKNYEDLSRQATKAQNTMEVARSKYGENSEQFKNSEKAYNEAQDSATAAGNAEEAARKEAEAYKTNIGAAFIQLKQDKAELWKKQAWASAASGAAAAAGTALTMGLMGTFDASTIAKTITGQTAMTAVTQLASGNYIGAAVSAAIGGVSFGLSKWFDYKEENEEKLKRLNDQVYNYTKAIEEDEKAQAKLNDTFDQANSKYEKQKEVYDNFNSAKDTYDELSKKVLLTEEEQEKLNEATKELAELHPELVQSYDAQGNAILKVGEAWDEAAKAEKDYYLQLKKDKLEAELEALRGEFKISEDYQKLDIQTRSQKREIAEGRAYATVDVNSRHMDVKTLPEIMKVKSWKDTTKNVDNMYLENVTGMRNWLEQFAKDNTTFSSAFVEATGEITKQNVQSVEDALNIIDEYDNPLEYAQKIYDKIAENFDEWSQSGKIDESKVKKAVSNIKFALGDYLDLQLDLKDFKGSEEAKKKLVTAIQNRKDLEEFIETEIYDKKGNINQEDMTNSILDKFDELVKAYEKADDHQLSLIADFYQNLHTNTVEENQKAREKLKKAKIDPIIIEQEIDFQIEDANSQGQDELNKLAEVYGSGFKGSKLEAVFTELGLKAKRAFNEAIANSGDEPEMQTLIVKQLNKLLSGSLKSIPTNILQNLMSLDWSSLSITDLNKTKQQFIDFAEEQGASLEEAKKYWNEYKDFMSTLGILNVVKDNLSTDAILEELENNLDEKLKSAKISGPIESSIKNGFLSFSESNEFRKACEQLGLKATDYIKEGVGGKEVIDVAKFKKDVKEQVKNEAEVIEQLKTEYETKIDTLKTQATLIRAAAGLAQEEEKVAAAISKAADQETRLALAADAARRGIAPNTAINYSGEGFTYDIEGKDKAEQTAQDIEDEATRLQLWVEKNLKEGSDFMTQYMSRLNSYQYEVLQAIISGEKAGAEAMGILEEAEKAQADATRNLTRAQEDLIEKDYQLKKASEALNKALYGDPNRVSKLDGLNNYSAILDDISKKAPKAREKLDDLQEGDNVDKLLSTYTTEIHNEVIIRGAENEVIKQAIANTETQLSKYSEYWSKFGNTYVINYEKLNATLSEASDMDRSKIQDKIEEDVEKLRSWTKQLQDNEDAVQKLRKQFEEDEKKALQNYVNLEKEVINTLKEQYEKQVNDLKEKNDAMKEADDDYLDALEKSINKERALRNRQNQWDDLAKKEKKLSLMSRDTSGSKQLEVQKLQQEVENDRTQLLDDTIDDVVDSLKEMYELQQESREAEIEYMESMLDNAELIKKANEVLQNIDSNEDLVNWFMANKDLSQMTAAELELEKKNWNDLYDAKILYEKQSKMDFDKYLETTQAEISKSMENISEDITGWSEKTWNTVQQQAKDALHDAEEAYKSAKRSYEDQELAMDQLKRTAAAAEQFYLELKRIINEDVSKKPDVADLLKEGKGPLAEKPEDVLTKYKPNDPTESLLKGTQQTITTTKTAGLYLTDDERVMSFNSIQQEQENKGKYPEHYPAPIVKHTGVISYKEEEYENYMNRLKLQNYHGYVDLDKKEIHYYPDNDFLMPTINNQYDAARYRRFASGGIVDYTGPAWVDGSPSSPEAFLSVDDTRLIGNLINLLTNIPSLNPNTNPTQFSTSNIGDTTVNLTVNFDSVSEDYDADRVIDLMKEKIVEAANYTGANVILNKR